MKRILRIILATFGLGGSIFLPTPNWGANCKTGATGLINIPTTEVVGEGKNQASFMVHSPPGDTLFSVQGSFGYDPRAEVSLGRFFSTRKNRDQDVLISPKYLFRRDMALGGLLDLTPGMRDSLYLITGFPKNQVYLGGGVNFGEKSDPLAHFGGYDAQGRVREGFLLFGAEIDIDKNLTGILDYNGNNFSFGVRYRLDQLLIAQFAVNTHSFNHKKNEVSLGVHLRRW